jgi:predicted transcriptional regulator
LEKETLPAETIRFIRTHIQSVDQLEILLLLHAEKTAFTAAQVNERQRSSINAVTSSLNSLIAQGLVKEEMTTPPTYVYAPGTKELSRAVDQLAGLYVFYRVRIIHTIYALPDPMQPFSDAFRLRKEPESDG